MQWRFRFEHTLTVPTLALAIPARAYTGFVDNRAGNPQVAADPGSNEDAVFPTNKQNEPTVALNPPDSELLIAVANEKQRQPWRGPAP